MSNVAHGGGGVWGSRTSEEAEYRIVSRRAMSEEAEYRIVWTEAGRTEEARLASLAAARSFVRWLVGCKDVRVQVRVWQDVEEQA